MYKQKKYINFYAQVKVNRNLVRCLDVINMLCVRKNGNILMIYIKRLDNFKVLIPKKYWNIINKSEYTKDNCSHIDTYTFMNYFKNLNQVSGTVPCDPQTLICGSVNEDLHKPVLEEEVNEQLKKLKINKSPGIDQITNELLKHSAPHVIQIITKWFNIILSSGIVRTSWTIGIIKPLYKGKGSKDNPDSYRGITLLSCLGKLFTSILNNRILNYVSYIGLIWDEQAGFRRNHSTLDHIFVLQSIISYYLNKKKVLSSDDVEVFLKLFTLLYADDTIILDHELQSALEGVKQYCDAWNLKVNTGKTKVVIFSRGKISLVET